MRIRAGKLCGKLAIAISLTLFGVRWLHADDITENAHDFTDNNPIDISVAAGEKMEINTDTYCNSLSVSGTLIVKARLILNSENNTNSENKANYVFAPDSTDNAIIELQGRGGIAGWRKENNTSDYDSRCYNCQIALGAGHGKVIVDTSTTDENNISGLCTFVIPSAPADSETIDFIEYKSGVNVFSGIVNNSAVPVRVKVTNNSVRLKVAAWGGIIFRGTGPSVFENTVGGPIVYAKCPWYPFSLSENPGTLTIKSDLVFDHHDANYLYTTATLRLELSKPINWENGANLITSNTIIKATSQNALPFGEGFGNVYSWSWSHTYNNGIDYTNDDGIKQPQMPYTGSIVMTADQCVNGIIGIGELGGYVYNSSTTTEPNLTLGTNDVVGVLKNVKMSNGNEAWTSGPINVKKVGTNELKIEKSNLGKNLTVYDGSVVVDGSAESIVPGKITLQPNKTLTVKAGSTLNTTGFIIDYFNVPANDCKNGSNDSCSYYWHNEKDNIQSLIKDFGSGQGSANVTVESGATLVLDAAEAAATENVALNVAGTLEKNGAGEYTFKGGAKTFSGNIKVNEGSLAFGGMGITDKYWRWTITKTGGTGGQVEKPLPMQARFTLRDKDGNNLTSGMSIDTAATSATKLAVKSFMIDNVNQMASEAFNQLFGINWHDTKGKITAIEGATIDSLVITFRLANDATPVTQYSFSTVGNENWPDTWTMESSPDGESWRQVDSREKQHLGARWNYETSWYAWWTDKRWGNFKGLPFTFNYANEPASDVSVEGAKVEVGARASLNLTGTTGNIAELTIDCANGAGTIIALNCGDTGAVYLKNTASLSLGNSIMETPNAVNANIRSWKVYFDGVAKNNYKAVIKNDAVAIISAGTRVIIK